MSHVNKISQKVYFAAQNQKKKMLGMWKFLLKRIHKSPEHVKIVKIECHSINYIIRSAEFTQKNGIDFMPLKCFFWQWTGKFVYLDHWFLL